MYGCTRIFWWQSEITVNSVDPVGAVDLIKAVELVADELQFSATGWNRWDSQLARTLELAQCVLTTGIWTDSTKI